MLDEQNSAVWNAILKHTPTEIEDIYKVSKQIRNCLNEYNKHRNIFHGLKNMTKKLNKDDKKVKKETKRKRFTDLGYQDSRSESDNQETRSRMKKLKTSEKETDDGAGELNPFTDDDNTGEDLDVSDDSYVDHDYVPEDKGGVIGLLKDFRLGLQMRKNRCKDFLTILSFFNY